MVIDSMPTTRQETIEFYQEKLQAAQDEGEEVFRAAERFLALNDLFFLLVYVLKRKDVNRDWLFDRCREVQRKPNGFIDLWSREHFKSSIITFGLTVFDILNDPNITVGIFSHTRPIAKAFLRQIKREFEGNEDLYRLFPDIVWKDPQHQSPKWALATDTPVLTTNGWKRHGELAPGDFVFGFDGSPVEVVGNSGPLPNAICHRVVFDDCELIASSEHLWPVEHKFGHSWSESDIRIYRTNELAVGKRTERMLPTPSIDFPEKKLSINPYLLGLWLGDGTAGTNIISMHNDDEPEILRLLSSMGREFYIHRKKDIDNFSMYGVRGLKEDMEKLGCLRKKHIPEDFLFASREQRLSLLQGLMDSDGTCKKESRSRCRGMCTFSNTNMNLADGVFWLAMSLGLRPSRHSFQPRDRGRKVANHVYFVGVKSTPPFRLKRKLDRCREARHKVGRYLRKIEKIDPVPVNCIKVNSPDGVYLAGTHLVPTHNSEDDGIILKRPANLREATVEAWGMVDGQPTGKHFKLRVYDDVVTPASVTTPEMIAKTNEAWALSLNLGTEDGAARHIGTFYHFNDTYHEIIDRKAAIPRIYPATDNGAEDGEPVLWTREMLAQKRREMGPYVFHCQILLNPVADRAQGFKKEWLQFWPARTTQGLNLYITVDPASKKKTTSDYTSIMVVGLGDDEIYRVVTMIRDRMNLTQRADTLFELHRLYRPLSVGYEEYGLQADIEHIKDRMDKENYRFAIVPCTGKMKKEDRIRRLIPLFEQGNMLLPEVCWRTNHEGENEDLTKLFINSEYLAFPVSHHDDMLDALSRIVDLPTRTPVKRQSRMGPSRTNSALKRIRR